MRIAIIGAGLAGSACAYTLKNAGHEVMVFEQAARSASAASGNEVGLYNPRLSALMDEKAAYYSSAFFEAQRAFEQFENINWKRFGSLLFVTDEKKETRFRKAVENWGWDDGDMSLVDAARASEICGVEVFDPALYLPKAGVVSPRKLCAAFLEGTDLRCGQKIETLQNEELAAFDKIILACGTGMRDFEEAAHVPLHHIRGQVTQIRASEFSRRLQCNLCYGGYCSPAIDGMHMVGATFQRWLDHSGIMEQDDAHNLEQLAAVQPELAAGAEVIGHRAAVRVAAKDVFPVVGPLDDRVYISGAHGSHGIISSIMAAAMLSEMLTGSVRCLPEETVAALSPHRFS